MRLYETYRDITEREWPTIWIIKEHNGGFIELSGDRYSFTYTKEKIYKWVKAGELERLTKQSTVDDLITE